MIAAPALALRIGADGLTEPPALVYVAVSTPAHSSVGSVLSYTSSLPLALGTLVRVPLGRREVLGVVWDTPIDTSLPEGLQPRPVVDVLDGVPPLAPAWRKLVAFTARYYQRSLGEVALSALPAQLRVFTSKQMERKLRRLTTTPARTHKAVSAATCESAKPTDLTAEQENACHQILSQKGTFLLYGATGSGKTEVYLHCVGQALTTNPLAQALVLVPEINLTPQLQARFHERFAPMYGAAAVASLHSGMTDAQRLASWLAAHTGTARIVLGTRMAIFASLPHLALIVVDEEHDPSYKQQEGARYSARDLAVWRGREQGAKVILGSATPSLESWHASSPEIARYQRLYMSSRIGSGAQPHLRLVDMGQQPRGTLFAPALLAAITERVERGQQCLVLLNRRGFAPVLHCHQCGWKSDCPHCSTHQVFHKSDRTLRCHHCGFTRRVPRGCPTCGNPDIVSVGHGTEQVQEQLATLLCNTVTPERRAVRVARIDADTTRAKGALQEQLAQVHAGEVDVLVGTQMIAKGHDFRRITLVAAVQPDAALFSSDFRAPERLLALLLQAAGRAGRDARYIAAQCDPPEVWVQTWHPEHAVYAALRGHDWSGFAHSELLARQQAGMPPFNHQALLRADARTQEVAWVFLQAAADVARIEPDLAALIQAGDISLYPPIPLPVQRVANVERAQILLESPNRPVLQRFLTAWQPLLHATRSQHKGLLRWLVDVDPQAI